METLYNHYTLHTNLASIISARLLDCWPMIHFPIYTALLICMAFPYFFHTHNIMTQDWIFLSKFGVLSTHFNGTNELTINKRSTVMSTFCTHCVILSLRLQQQHFLPTNLNLFHPNFKKKSLPNINSSKTTCLDITLKRLDQNAESGSAY